MPATSVAIMLSPATGLDGWAKFPIAPADHTSAQAAQPFKEGTKGRLYFSAPESRPGAVDARVWKMEDDGVVFQITGPPIAPPPLDSIARARQVHLSGSWLWAWEAS